MNARSTPGSTACPDPLVFTAPETSSARTELLSICERLAKVWSDRVQTEGKLWDNLKLELAATANAEDAVRAYSKHAAQRMRLALEDAQRIFEEHQAVTARLSRLQG